MTVSLQDQYAANSICFGCGPANPQGLHLKSVVSDDAVIAHYKPANHHHAFPNVLCGGIIGTLLDCHCNWSACYYLMLHHQLNHPPCTVTANYTITLKRPTPMNQTLTLKAVLDKIQENQAIISGEILIEKTVFATCQATFVAVKPDHPAYHRW